MVRRRIALGALPGLVLCACGVALGEDAPTGDVTVLHLGRRVPGLERQLPRGGAYARAFAALREGSAREAEDPRRYAEAADRFTQAQSELHHAALEGRIAPGLARTLGLKALLLGADVRALGEAYAHGEGGHRGPSEKLRIALVLHELYLASSAYLEREDRELYQRAARAYESLIADRSDGRGEGGAIARLGHAALLAAGGQRAAAASELVRALSLEHASELHELIAEYHAYAGDPDRAFAELYVMRAQSPDWPRQSAHLRALNDLDPLREDPRFARLLGED